MPSEAYARLWAIVGFTTLLYVLFVWSKGQGGPAIGTGIVLDDRPVVGMYYAAFVTGILLSLLCVFGIRFAAKTPQRPWCLRIPVV